MYDIWNTYLTKFIHRYGGKKLERTRDLFEQCLQDCPAKFAKHFYLMYAKLEESHGLARQAMTVYERGCKAVLKEEQYEMFNVYLKKAAELFGITFTREIYERAIELLADDQARDMCIRFADLERKLGEIDRARAIYAHCAQMCDPRVSVYLCLKGVEIDQSEVGYRRWLLSFGRYGRILRSVTETRIRSGRC